MDGTKKKRGRPKQEGSRKRQYRLLMTDEEFDELTKLSKITNKSKSDYVRESLRMMKNLVEATNDVPENDEYDENYYEKYYEDGHDDVDDDEI